MGTVCRVVEDRETEGERDTYIYIYLYIRTLI